jgi:hypothetical protein
MSVAADLAQIGDAIFRVPLRFKMPVSVAFLVIVALVVIAGLILEKRVRGVEVVA